MRSTWRDRDRDFQKPLADGETTAERLTQVLHATITECRPVPGFEDEDEITDATSVFMQSIDCNEVYPGIYIGNAHTARLWKYLQTLGVTHVLNAAEGTKFGFANINKFNYQNTEIEYLGLPLSDMESTDISKYFDTAADFIERGLSSGGKVFVNCLQGVSRSATCVLAYLMIKKGMLAVDAIKIVRTNRFILPNQGFLRQLAQLDNQLRRQRL